MTKADIVEVIHERTGILKREAVSHVESLLEIIKNALERGETVKIAGFGIFEVKEKKARLGRNPQTGEAITIERRRVLSFKVSQILRQAVNKQ